VRGNLIPDVHLAAILRQHGVNVLYTNDADFPKILVPGSPQSVQYLN
jgi:predicted nucleic acid-binding protein